MRRVLCVCIAAFAFTLLALTALSGTAEGETSAPAERRAAFSDGAPAIAADIQAGRPFVTVVVVPLCSNDQIDCGGSAAGRPGDLRTNIYWGAVFGQKRYFNRKNSGWALVDAALDPEPSVLERAVFRRAAPRAAWSAEGGAETIEQIVVLEAVHGDAIDLAVKRFYRLATEGGRVSFQDGGRERDERVHVAGYAGHNRLMDGVKLPPAPAARSAGKAPIPSFVMACQSDAYFSDGLRLGGSAPIVMTRALMAPEGYVVEAIARALGENAAPREVRARAVAAYAKWASLPIGTASWIFAPSP